MTPRKRPGCCGAAGLPGLQRVRRQQRQWVDVDVSQHPVGDEHDEKSALAFTARNNGKWSADIFLLAQQRLTEAGVTEVYGGGVCTFSDPARFFSYRRDGNTGRMAGFIWLAA